MVTFKKIKSIVWKENIRNLVVKKMNNEKIINFSFYFASTNYK